MQWRGSAQRLLLEEKLAAKLTDEVCGSRHALFGLFGEYKTAVTPHPPPAEVPSPQGEGFGAVIIMAFTSFPPARGTSDRSRPVLVLFL